MFTKQQVLDEIIRTAKENGGKPLGMAKFEKETGIKPYDWKKFWPRFGDAQKEAGFDPNQLQNSYDDEFVIKKMVSLMRKLGKFPAHGELRIARNNDPEFPSSGSLFDSKEQKIKLATKILEWSKKQTGCEDIMELCEKVLEKQNNHEDFKNADNSNEVGEVYLFKSGKYYKIGKTFDTVRRGSEIRIQLPEKIDLVHSIQTDDPSGVETYWHRRFEAKRMNGEWFNLNAADVKAFKRWRRIV